MSPGRNAARAAPEALIDLERYPVTRLGSPEGRRVLEGLRRGRDERGVAILPGFVKPEAVAAMVRQTEALLPRAHREDVGAGTPYLELPDRTFPEGHPRRSAIRSVTWVLAYDLIPREAAVRALYEWDPLMAFVAAILERDAIHRFADPLGALNLAVMVEGDVQGWHYDSTDFVVSLGLQSPRAGGHFECAARIRSAEDENYAEVSRVLREEAPERVEIYPMTPGTLMVFEGRHSLHRVSPVQGDVPRHVALFGYDTKPGTDASDLLKLVRYGRTEPLDTARGAAAHPEARPQTGQSPR